MYRTKRVGLVALLILLTTATGALASDDPVSLQLNTGNLGMHHGQPVGMAKASRDTIYLIGGPDSFDGQFQTQWGDPDWHDWETVDLTYSNEMRWNVSDYNPINGAYSQLCGKEFQTNCGFGYGNGWNESLVFAYDVPNPSFSLAGNIDAQLLVDTEPGFDYVYFEINRSGTWEILGQWDDVQLVPVDIDFAAESGDYVGGQLQIRFRVQSDSGYSDEDCDYDSDGAARLDDIIVTIDGSPVSSENFEDGLSQDWQQVLDPGVGDFAMLYTNLADLDVCRENPTAQVAFIDDGVVVPGTGGSPCVSWCYGPGGYVVNCTGGLMGPDYHIDNAIRTPVMAWPAGAEGAELALDNYVHESLSQSAPGMFWQWHVRSTNSANPAEIENADWRNRNLVQYGDPGYVRVSEVVSDLLEPGRTFVQVQLKVLEYGWVWGWNGVDGYPAPYFDNVQFKAYPFLGPAISIRNTDMAQDSFPERGDIDYSNLANNWVRWDMGRNIASQASMMIDPGDSIIADIAAVRDGSVLDGLPRLYFKLKANPVFDGVRVLPPNATQDGDFVDGFVEGHITYDNSGNPVDTEFWFDLPDSDFFFPGDVLHYYLWAQDQTAGGDVGTTIVPADTAGFSSFEHDLTYDSDFITRALPTMFSATPGDQPRILLWNDFANYGGENEWKFALWNLGLYEARDYDVFYTMDPDGGLGNGLGSRATSSLIGGYDILLYTVGNLSVNTLANGDFNNDPSPDLQLLNNWFQLGDKHAFFTGDDLVFSLTQSGSEGLAFIGNYLGVRFVERSVNGLIGGQSAPTVIRETGNSVVSVPEWVAYGGCVGINTFDAVETTGTAERLAQFTTASGQGGAYPYSAATYYLNESVNSKVISLPYDFMFLYNAPGYVPPQAGMSARGQFLQDVLLFFGQTPGSNPTDVPQQRVLSVSNHPNPFNPQTTIRLDLPRTGHVSLKVFNLRGELVRTLVDGQMTAGEHAVLWDGTSDQGEPAASGVYFYETRAGGEVKLGKMALVK